MTVQWDDGRRLAAGFVKLAKLNDALTSDRLFVKIGRSWFLARQERIWEFDDGFWIMKVVAGPHKSRGIITADGGPDNRQFLIAN